MEVRRIEASIGAGRGDIVVCIRVQDGGGLPFLCLDSVLAHTEPGVAVVVCGQLSAAGLDRVQESSARAIWIAETLEKALAATSPADVVVLGHDCVVAEGWLSGLRETAYVDSRVATATPITVGHANASIGELPERTSFEAAASVVSTHSPRIRPRLTAPAGGPCAYVRRTALELIGDGDPPGDEFSRRSVEHGMSHVLADDVLVLSGPPKSLDSAAPDDATAPVRRSLGAARRAVNGLSLVIDGRVLAGPMNGSKVHVLELIAALARTGEARVTAIVPSDLSAEARPVLEALPELNLLTPREGQDLRSVKPDVVHRPVQFHAAADLATLAALGDRLVITQQDLIGYNNPSYWRSQEDWRDYRRLTRTALGLADRVVFFSAHARDDAVGEDLVEPHRASVVPIGVDHQVSRVDQAEATAPQAAGGIPDDAEMMLCLGTDYRHKNRVFALRLLDELQRRHGWPGRLVLAGEGMPCGSSQPEEQRLLAGLPELADAVLDVGVVSEAEKAWLLGRADLVLYPTVYEGFGLVPFEAADHGVPCLWAPGTSLSELLPDSRAGIVAWEVSPSAERALALLRDGEARARNVETVRAAGAHLRWDGTAKHLIQLYRSVCDAPAAPARTLRGFEMWSGDGMGEDALRLVGPGGALPRDLERPLLALATHPRVATPVFSAIKAGYRASYRWRRMVLRRNQASSSR